MIQVSFPEKKMKGRKIFTFEKELVCGRIAECDYNFHEFKKMCEEITGLKMTDQQFESIVAISVGCFINPLLMNIEKSCKMCGKCK